MILQEVLSRRDPFIPRKVQEHMQRLANRAKCFVFDEEASRLIGQFCGECPDLIFDHRQFAKPPYDVTYIEYHSMSVRNGMKLTHTATDDDITGFLIDGHMIYCVVGKNPRLNTKALIWPVMYYAGDRNTVVDYKSPFPVMNYGRENPISVKLATIIGSAFELFLPIGDAPITKGDDAKLRARLRGRLKVLFNDLYNSNEAYWIGDPKVWGETISISTLQESLGDLKLVWGGLLWLQSVPKTVTYNAVPGGSAIVRGKRVALSAHHTVHIHLKGAKSIRRKYLSAAGKRNSPREHEVRGHWCHRGGLATGCSHVWPAEPNTKHQFICEKCQRKRWYRKSFKRGDASRGFVEKDYKAEL